MTNEKDDSASLAAVESAGSIAPDAAPHVAKHTPGPWKTTLHFIDPVEHGSYPDDVDPTDHHSIATCHGPNWKANAHLIAAAPEMKSALRARVWAEHDNATHWPAGSTRYGHTGAFESCPHAECRLIAKAEGRE